MLCMITYQHYTYQIVRCYNCRACTLYYCMLPSVVVHYKCKLMCRRWAFILVLGGSLSVYLAVRKTEHVKQSVSRKDYLEDQNLSRRDSLIYNYEKSNKPTILIWYPPFGRKNEYEVNKRTCGRELECHVTYDRSLVDVSDALVFHFKSLELKTMPARRRLDQLYVWWSGEKNHNRKLHEFDNVFNLTFTYRRDSGIYAPYGSTDIILKELLQAKEYDLETLLKKKRKLAAWVISNCGVRHRMDIARNITEAGLKVDTFGRCFGGKKIANGTAFYETLSQYKFYLAFENGYHCRDYITEKFWYNGLRSGAVPVVWGAKKEDVLAVAPEESFIHLDDFENPKDLVNYLLYLDHNETAYRKYLKWRTTSLDLKKDEVGHVDELHSFCKLCHILHGNKELTRKGENIEKFVVPSLHKWWWNEENLECIRHDILDVLFPREAAANNIHLQEAMFKVIRLDSL